jgi:18S rRNA (adenine1779-N6/adenine1780-N6)-dimethyltransferase
MWAKIDHVMKVGRNNFNPPPQVESSVVRIAPIVPRPAISFDEWDGLLRICFVRKNKTLSSSFVGTTSIMDLLERNYRTWCAQNDIILEDGPVEEGDVEMEEVEETPQEEEWGGLDDDNEEDELPDFFKEEMSRRNEAQTSRERSRKKKGKVSELVRSKVKKVLDTTGLASIRARMCDQNDFLRLLESFNEEGIHFA